MAAHSENENKISEINRKKQLITPQNFHTIDFGQMDKPKKIKKVDN